MLNLKHRGLYSSHCVYLFSVVVLVLVVILVITDVIKYFRSHDNNHNVYERWKNRVLHGKNKERLNMLIDVHSVIRITNDITGKHFNVAFTKEEDEKYVVDGKLSEKFMMETFNEYNILKYKKGE